MNQRFILTTVALYLSAFAMAMIGGTTLILSQTSPSTSTQQHVVMQQSFDEPSKRFTDDVSPARNSNSVRYADQWPGIDKTGDRDSAPGFTSLFSGGGYVVVPQGTYLISSTVTLADNLYVLNQGGTFIAGKDDLTMFSSPTHAYYTQLLNFTLDGNGHTAVTGFSLTQFIIRSRIDNVVMRHMTNGIVLLQLCWDTIIDNPRAESVAYPLVIENGSNVVDVRHPAFDAYTTGVQIVNGPTYPTVGVRITGGYIQNGNSGIVDHAYGTQISDTYFEGNKEADVLLSGSILSYIKGTQHFANSGAVAIKGRNASGCRLEGVVMGSGARSVGLYDFDKSNSNCVEWHANTTSSLNVPLGVTSGLGSVAARDASGSLGDVKGASGEFTNLLTAHRGLIVQGGPATLKNGVKVGASGATISDSRELMQSVHHCGTTTTCGNKANGSYWQVFGTIPLTDGTATLTGISPGFTSHSTFGCTCTDQTSAAACKALPDSPSSVRFSGTDSDVLFYSCIGN
jgi:hypothetical protein